MNTHIFYWLFATMALCFRTVLCESFTPTASWENLEYKRVLDVTKGYFAEKIALRVKNVDSIPISEYYLALPAHSAGKVSIFTAAIPGTDTYLNCQLVPNITVFNDGDFASYGVVHIPTPIEPNQEFSFVAAIYYNVVGIPYPEHIAITDDQYLLTETDRLPFSAYRTYEGTFSITGSDSFEEINLPENENLRGSIEGKSIVFGPWNDIQPFEKEEPVNVVYLHNAPLSDVTFLKRDVWVSHWASTLEFEEYYELTNKGAKLEKGFSRLELMKDQQQKLSIQRTHYMALIEMILPKGSFGHYYTDLVGMVSTSHVQEDHFVLKPRYPIFGGWNYNFTIGWTNQLSDFLRVSDEEDMYILSVPLLDGQQDSSYDNTQLSIYLPEGAKIANVDAPVPFVNLSLNTEKSYFDLNKGHVKVTFNFKNLANEIADGRILIKYQYTQAAFYKKPVSIAIYIFVALMSFFLLKNINLTVTDK